ncbi:MAG: lipopolysaccharide core heptose(I) kinase RfaP [Gammaproteobacteria bacterium]|nr:lipopolysaccharide core heptose(I) kinase RfaP [Gammaproteobacteria bacterium]
MNTIDLTWLNTAVNAALPLSCKDKGIFFYLKKYPGIIYRKVKNRETKAIIYQGKSYFVKVHEGVGWKEIFKNLLRGRLPVLGATLEWEAILRCQQAKILTTPLVGYGKWGILNKQCSFILTRDLKETLSLETLGQAWEVNPPLFTVKRQIIRELAKTARLFHQQKLIHRDFYLCHFLVPQAVLSAEKLLPTLPIYIIDLHRAKIKRFFRTTLLVKDLGGLLFSSLDFSLGNRDYLYFIKHYERSNLKEALKKYAFWNKVINRAKRLYYREHGCCSQRTVSFRFNDMLKARRVY